MLCSLTSFFTINLSPLALTESLDNLLRLPHLLASVPLVPPSLCYSAIARKACQFAPMLCSACQSIFRGPLIFDEDGRSEHRDHHLTAQSLAHAIRQNCYICSSTFQQYQGDKASTLGPSQFEEGLEGMKYYLRRGDSPRDLTLCLWWYWLDVTISHLRYVEHEIKMRRFVQLKSAPAGIPL